MTGAEFYAYVLRTFKRTDKSTEVYEAVNDTLREMRRRHAFNENLVESYTTGISALGEYTLEIPSNMGIVVSDVVLSKTDTDYGPLTKLAKFEFDRAYPNPTSTNVNKSQPRHYCVFANHILIGPVPDSVYYLYTVSYSTRLVTEIGASTAIMPFADFLEGIKYGALARLYAGLGDDAEALKWVNMFEKMYIEYIDQDINNLSAPLRVDYHGV